MDKINLMPDMRPQYVSEENVTFVVTGNLEIVLVHHRSGQTKNIKHYFWFNSCCVRQIKEAFSLTWSFSSELARENSILEARAKLVFVTLSRRRTSSNTESVSASSVSLAVMCEDRAEKMERFVAASTLVVLDLREYRVDSSTILGVHSTT